MMINIATPALLFPAISFLFLAYSNRYIAIANRIRDLHNKFMSTQNPLARRQIESLRTRIRLIVWMQCFAVTGIVGCIVSMGLIFFEIQFYGNFIFGLSMVLITISLFISLAELLISTQALNIELADMEHKNTLPLPSQTS